MYFINDYKDLSVLGYFLFLFVDYLLAADVLNNPKIAIIGAGIGGTSCSYFLNELYQGKIDIDLYEANKVGGRLRLQEINGTFFEVGGTIIHPRNKYMTDFVQQFGLNRKEGYSEGIAGFYNGQEFTFIESRSQYVTLLKMLWHYGIDLFKLNSYVNSMLDHFERIYDRQKKGKGYENVGDLLDAMDPEFLNYLTKTIDNGFKKDQGFNKKLVDELVFATIRVNYGQTNMVHQFVGSVSVAGAMDGLWAVEGGNYQVAEQLIKRSHAKLINKKVDSINLVELNNSTRFAISSDNKLIEYDAVVVAAPLTKDAHFPVAFRNFPSQLSVPGIYHTTICTLVTGVINNTFFGYDQVPESIFAINQHLFFNSISLLKSDGVNSVFKVFSQTVLTNQQLNMLFKKFTCVNVVNWLAYPEYSVHQRNDTFILYDRLYYINAIEWAASAMEMSVIGAKNVALLLYNNFMKAHTNLLPTREEL